MPAATNRREFVSFLTAACASVSAAVPLRGPNIVLFLIDDLGYGDLGCYGNTFVETPNIDRLARESLRFTNTYGAAPVCSPSRAAILTGTAPARSHLTQWIPGVSYPHKLLREAPSAQHLDVHAVTLATQLKQAGYQTAAIGKWHLGGEHFLPEDFGFDTNVAGDVHGHPPSYFGPYSFHNLTGNADNDYLTDVLTTKMDAYIQQAAKQPAPFFLYMAEYSVHLPLEAKQAMVAKYRHKNGGREELDPVYAAMIESTDQAVGSLRSALERAGIADNTVILLTSDNGGVGFQGTDLHRIDNNGSLRAGKGFLYEGDWKLIEFFEDNHVELYNLAVDPGEQYNFASSFAPKAEALHRKLQLWRAQMNALMPAPNPDFNPSLAQFHTGTAGCSWQPSLTCREV